MAKVPAAFALGATRGFTTGCQGLGPDVALPPSTPPSRLSFSTRVVRLRPSRRAACWRFPARVFQRPLNQLALDGREMRGQVEALFGNGGRGRRLGQRGLLQFPGQIVDIDPGPGPAQGERAFDGVLELTDVPRPRVAHHAAHRRLRDRHLPRPALLPAEGFHEVTDQQRDVLAPFPEWRQVDGDDVETVVQVFAEPALTHHLQEVCVGGGDDADIDSDRPVVSDAFELAFLQHPQQLGLQEAAHGADLVEKERPPVRRFQPSRPRGDGAGVGAADMAEQLGLEQGLGHRAAVEGDEAMPAPGAVVVNRLGRQLLAGAGLPGDEDGARARGHGLQQVEQLAHPGAAAHQPFESVPFLNL